MRFIGPFRKRARLHKLRHLRIAAVNRFVKLIKDGMLGNGIVVAGPDELYVVEGFELSRDGRTLIGGEIPGLNFQVRLQLCVGFRGILGMHRR